MREMKCRAWDGNQRRFIYKCNWNNKLQMAYWYEGAMAVSVDADKVTWYTGLRDKNGKEIWEGDILKLYIYDTVYAIVKFGEYCGMDFYDLPNYGFYTKSVSDDMDMRPLVESKDKEVIGNIYENPELISKSKSNED